VQRLVLSRCYLDSADFPGGGLSCETCHDPHRSVFEPAERARVRAACLACHETPPEDVRHAADCALAAAERADRDCASCHMRVTGVFDVVGVAIHDHLVARRPAAPSSSSPSKPLRFPESPAGDWRLFEWPDAPPRADADDPGPWTMALAHGGHVERALEHLRRGPGARARHLPMLHHVRGSLLERAGELPAAVQAYEHALALEPGFPPATINLAPLLARAGKGQAALALLDGVIARHPLADTAYRNRAVVRLGLGDVDGFRADAEAALRLLPDAELALALARVAEPSGDPAAAQRWKLEARALDPRVE
jgi:predicted CXXCH cytochrome family protein